MNFIETINVKEFNELKKGKCRFPIKYIGTDKINNISERDFNSYFRPIFMKEKNNNVINHIMNKLNELESVYDNIHHIHIDLDETQRLWDEIDHDFDRYSSVIDVAYFDTMENMLHGREHDLYYSVDMYFIVFGNIQYLFKYDNQLGFYIRDLNKGYYNAPCYDEIFRIKNDSYVRKKREDDQKPYITFDKKHGYDVRYYDYNRFFVTDDSCDFEQIAETYLYQLKDMFYRLKHNNESFNFDKVLIDREGNEAIIIIDFDAEDYENGDGCHVACIAGHTNYYLNHINVESIDVVEKAIEIIENAVNHIDGTIGYIDYYKGDYDTGKFELILPIKSNKNI